MGYTHYWSFNQSIRGRTREVEQKYQEALTLASTAALLFSERYGGVSGFTAHTLPGQYGGMLLNGSENSGICEDFIMRERYKLNDARNFCKTGRYAYDVPVTAALCILSSILGDDIEVGSDGDTGDWAEGLALAREVLEDADIPAGIRKAKLRAV